MLQAGLRSRLDGAILSYCGGAGLGSSPGAPAQPRGGGDGSTGGHRGVSVHFTQRADGPDRGTFNREVTQGTSGGLM